MNRIPDTQWVTLGVDFLDRYKLVYGAARHIESADRRNELMRRYVSAICRLKGVKEVIDDHCVWLKFEPSSRTFGGIHKESKEIESKIDAITQRYIATAQRRK